MRANNVCEDMGSPPSLPWINICGILIDGVYTCAANSSQGKTEDGGAELNIDGV